MVATHIWPHDRTHIAAWPHIRALTLTPAPVCAQVAKHGEVERSQAVPASAGHLYLQFASAEGAAACVAALHGRWFAGKQVAAATIDEAEWPAKEAPKEEA